MFRRVFLLIFFVVVSVYPQQIKQHIDDNTKDFLLKSLEVDNCHSLNEQLNERFAGKSVYGLEREQTRVSDGWMKCYIEWRISQKKLAGVGFRESDWIKFHLGYYLGYLKSSLNSSPPPIWTEFFLGHKVSEYGELTWKPDVVVEQLEQLKAQGILLLKGEKSWDGGDFTVEIEKTNVKGDGELVRYNDDRVAKWQTIIMSTSSGISESEPIERQVLSIELTSDDLERHLYYWGVNTDGMFVIIVDFDSGKVIGRLYF